MAGVKGRSGRKSVRDETKRLAIIDLAWDITKRYLEDESHPIKERVEVAKTICAKDMPEKLTDGDGNSLPRPIINIFGARVSSDRLLPATESDPSITSSE